MQQGRLIAFYSKALGSKYLGFTTYEKELLPIIMVVSKWWTYLLGYHFIIHIDQQNIKFFMEQWLTTLLQQRWLSKLLGLDYEIGYKKGTDNLVIDALSRIIEDSGD